MQWGCLCDETVLTVIGEDNQTVTQGDDLLVVWVEVQAVISFGHIPAHNALFEAAPHIPACNPAVALFR